jgi:hypothetical protein
VNRLRVLLDHFKRNRAGEPDDLSLLQAFIITKPMLAFSFSAEQDSGAAISARCHCDFLYYYKFPKGYILLDRVRNARILFLG